MFQYQVARDAEVYVEVTVNYTQKSFTIEINTTGLNLDPIRVPETVVVEANASLRLLAARVERRLRTYMDGIDKAVPDYARCLIGWYIEVGTAVGGFQLLRSNKTLNDYSGLEEEELVAKVTIGLIKPTIDNIKSYPREMLATVPDPKTFNKYLRTIAQTAGEGHRKLRRSRAAMKSLVVEDDPAEADDPDYSEGTAISRKKDWYDSDRPSYRKKLGAEAEALVSDDFSNHWELDEAIENSTKYEEWLQKLREQD